MGSGDADHFDAVLRSLEEVRVHEGEGRAEQKPGTLDEEVRDDQDQRSQQTDGTHRDDRATARSAATLSSEDQAVDNPVHDEEHEDPGDEEPERRRKAGSAGRR